MTALERLRHMADGLYSATAFAEARRLRLLIAEIEQRERQVERLIAAGQIMRHSGPTSGDKAWDEAVADLQANSPPPLARDPIPDTGGKIKW